MHPHQVHFHPEGAWARRADLEQALLHPPPQVYAYRGDIANDLARRFFERKIDRRFASPARGFYEMGAQAWLAGARGAAHQNRAAAIVSAPGEHLVQPGTPLDTASLVA